MRVFLRNSGVKGERGVIGELDTSVGEENEKRKGENPQNEERSDEEELENLR